MKTPDETVINMFASLLIAFVRAVFRHARARSWSYVDPKDVSGFSLIIRTNLFAASGSFHPTLTLTSVAIKIKEILICDFIH